MDELESVHCVILGRLWEWQPPLLLGQAAVTQLTCVRCRHQESGLIIIINLRQMSLSLFLLLAI